MICVSVGRGRHKMMIAEHRHLAEQGAELVELRLDYIRRAVNLRRLLDDRQCPVVATCRRKKEHGRWEGSESDRQMLLRAAIADGADYVDLEMDIADKIPRYGNTQRIISYHNFEQTPDNIEEIHHRISQLDPDIIKIATMANNPIDNIKLLRLCRDSDIPTTAFCMGDMGLTSRVLCGRAGAPMTYATFSSDRKMAPGQLSFKEMREDYCYDSINEDTVILGVIADPVAHSLSPVVHNAVIRELGLNMLYMPFRVPKEYLDEFIKICPEMGIKGLSVTIPHKERCLKSINVLDDNVAGIKAANTIVFEDVNAFGFNTDCSAAMTSIENKLVEVRPDEEPFANRKFTLLGSGGVARAIAFGLKRRNAQVFICGRDYRKSEALADSLKCDSIDWTTRANFETSVLVNCTPVGMHPNMDESPFDAEWFDKNTIAFDTIYNPEQTLFIKEARKAGCETITGVDMFVRQAGEQFELFTGKPADLDKFRYELKRATSPAKYYRGQQDKEKGAVRQQRVFLIGYRGAGKSSVAKVLAKSLGWKVYDTDDLIEKSTGKTIADIFEEQGEEYFRRLEASAVKEICQKKDKVVVALGGGAPTVEKIRTLIKRKGNVIWLRATDDTLIERIESDPKSSNQRPNLTPQGGRDEVQTMLRKRSTVYESCAEMTVDVDMVKPSGVARIIAQWLADDQGNG
ncbi:MAG: shikimate dehydrogenase [Planctomycetota bacterium]